MFAGTRLIAFVLTALTWSVVPRHVAMAQDYPTRTITIVVPSSAGGPADVSARLVVDRLSKALGQQLVIETAPGAGGTIGMGRVARAAPDGYTLLIHQNGFAVTPSLYAKLPFDTVKDFVTVGLVNRSTSILVGRKDLPPNTFGELVQWMKGPGKPAKVAHPGAGTIGHLTTTILLRTVGVEASLISYRGIAPAVNDLLGGHIDVASVALAVAAPLVQGGKLKAYASSASKRSTLLPQVPSYGEAGYPQLERPLWHALFAPAATPRPIVEKLNTALQETLSDEAVLKLYEKSGVEAYPKEFWSLKGAGDYVANEIEIWGKAVRDHKLRIE
jgi:tripartite-type tricarboxylate transporter receptor subunit TctC